MRKKNKLVCGAARGEYPLGVRAFKPGSIQGLINTSYRAQCSDGYGKQISKTYKTIEEAQNWYSITKKNSSRASIQSI